jgi:polyphosphate kinase
MNRNMFGRIELAWQVTDPVLRQRIIDECLVAYMHDTSNAWDLQADGTYQRVKPPAHGRKEGAQAALMVRYGTQAIGSVSKAGKPASKSRTLSQNNAANKSRKSKVN